jgi:hypothetical protein
MDQTFSPAQSILYRLSRALTISLFLLSSACGVNDGSISAGGAGAPAPFNASIQLTWEAPNQNTDSSCLTDLTGYHIYYGTSMGSYTNSRTINAGNISCGSSTTTNACGVVQTCTYKVNNVPSGILYVAIQAYNSSGVVSSDSNTVSKLAQ